MNINKVIKPIIIYIVQVGALWGLLEAYSYFKGDDLKNLLGSFWVLIYILPLFTTGYVMWRDKNKKEPPQETISTEGNYSPGKVDGNYSVGTQPHQPDISNPQNTTASLPQDNPDVTEKISTRGDYSPGKVEKNYLVKASENPAQPLSDAERQDETDQEASQADIEIHTKGNYSPGQVGGDYTVDIE